VQANIWVSSAPPWHHIDSAVPRFPRNPEAGLKGLLELARASVVRLGRATGLSRKDAV
jgi:hypothetical protein